MDDIDAKIHELRNRWQLEEIEREERRAELRLQKLQKRRDALDSGEWRPPCRCQKCLRSIYELTAPDGLCDKGRKEIWW